MIQSVDIMDRLKADTRELHDQAESHPFQSRLVKGELSRGGYCNYLNAMYHVHQALESELMEAGGSNPTVGEFPYESRFRVEAVRRDLAYFERDPSVLPVLEPVSDLCGQLNKTRLNAPCSLLGHLYVLEGSSNGTRFIARGVRRAYRLNGTDGTAYLDPYGDNHRSEWALFKVQMRALELSAATADQIVDGAKAMFSGITMISDALLEVESAGKGISTKSSKNRMPKLSSELTPETRIIEAVV